MNVFDYYKNEMVYFIKYSQKDEECAHIKSDDLLCEIAISAAEGDLNIDEVYELIHLYEEVNKWYA